MKLMTKNVVLGLTFSLVLAVAFVPQLFAEETENGGDSTENTPPTTQRSGEKSTQTKTTEQESETETRREVAREKLDSRKKALCESREGTVNKAITNVGERSQNHFDRITKIYDLSLTFYTEKGLSIGNYDELVASVISTKAIAETALTELKSTPQLSCDSDGPKADLQEFRNRRLDKVEAFSAYRDAVKAFVKAVKAAAEATETSETQEPQPAEGTN